jgi:GcrA cell cycle regulator
MEQNKNYLWIGAPSMTWTDARIAQLTRLWAEGLSAAGIAEALGEVSRSAVLGKLYRLELLGSRKPASAPRRYAPAADARPTLAESLRLRAASLPSQESPEPPKSAPEPPRSSWREAAFAPLAGATPRPWLSRAVGECAFPVGGDGDALVSCCARVKPRSAYCPAHHAVVFKPAAAAEQQRWVQAAERWAA